MRVRRMLVSCGFLDLWLGVVLVLAPFALPSARRTLLAFILDLTYGCGFLLAALLCAGAFVLWSEAMQRHVALGWIRGMRIAARTLGFSMALAFLFIEVLAAFLAHWTLSSVEVLGLAASVLIQHSTALSDGQLTPLQEALVWEQQTKGQKQWTLRWLHWSRQ